MRNDWRLTGIAAAAAILAAGAPAWGAAADADFVKAAASGGKMEVELGRYAAKHAQDAEVRSFGERMAADHGKANQELETVARGAGHPVPAQMTAEHRDEVQKLTKLEGAEFDEAYMDAMAKDHEHDVDAFRAQADEKKSDVDRWAARTLPTLEQHLAHAKRVAEKVEAGAGAAGRSGSGNMGGDAGRVLDPSVTGVPGRP
jgi:putative membrane protein